MNAILRRFFLTASLFTLAAASVGYGLWRHGVLQAWVLGKAEGAIVQFYNQKLRNQLPFQVEKIEYHRSWTDLTLGRLDRVAITLKKDDLRIHLEGPLRFPSIRWATFKQLYRKLRELPLEHADDAIELEYSPVVTFEALRASERAKLPDAVAANLQVGLSGEINELQRIKLILTSLHNEPAWHWKSMGIEIQTPRLELEWPKAGTDSDNSLLHAEFKAASFAYKDAARLVRPQIDLQAPLWLKPFAIGNQIALNWKAESGEALLGDRYFSVAAPQGAAPAAANDLLHGEAELSLRNSKWSALKLAIGKSREHPLRLQVIPRASSAQISLELNALSLKDAIPVFLNSTSNAGAPFTNLSFLQEIDLKEGKLSVSAQGTIPLDSARLPDFSRISTEGKITEANAQLEDVSFLWPAHQLAVKKLHLSLPYTSHKGFEGNLSVGRFGFRKLRGRLLPTRISFQENQKRSTFRIGEKGSRIPLDLDGLLLKIDSIGGTANLLPLEYNLETHASLEPTAVEQIVGPLCLVKPGSKVPPAKVRLSLPKIEITPAGTDLTGFVRADLFGGFIQIDEMGVYDFLSAVPEFDFNLKMEGIDLQGLGDWVGFGEMDGTLSAFAHDVVFQSSLPTQYDFEIKVKPLHHDDVVFSPTAMKNFARLFTPDGIDNIPGYAQWLAFGWPSRLLGGYDISYAGVHLRSEDGYIHLETLDPAEPVSESSSNNSHQKHFILYGRRFKIPLKSSRYPLILDAPAMGNFVHRMFERIQELAKSKKGETSHDGQNDGHNEEQTETDTLPASCIPSDLSRL